MVTTDNIAATADITDSGPLETFDLGRKLRQRLRETNEEREKIQAKLNILSDHLQRMFARTPKKPRDTEEQMENKIAKLEYQRTTSSLTLSEEKQVLRQIEMIKRSKKVLDEYQEHEHAIQEKKSGISDLRDSLRTVVAQIAELESALSKVELAKRLGCTTSELETRVVDCPADKIGQIIGKNGSSLKQLEDRTGVQVDVDKVGSKIYLQGSEAALEAAVREVENITLAVEEEIELSHAIVTYLISQKSAVLNKLQASNPLVHFDLPKNSSSLRLRGRPENILPAKVQIQSLDVKTLTRDLSSRETGLIVGKGGSTVNKLVSDHDVSINVSNDGNKASKGAVVEITGPTPNVDAALEEVEEILHQNEEIEDYVIVQHMQRNMFLANGGANIKEIQAEVSGGSGKGGVLLLFEKRNFGEGDGPGKSSSMSKEPSKLYIKASRANMAKAMELVQNRITAHEETVLTMSVDPDMIPAIIGKGGATINSLRQEGTGAEIEIEKDSGVIRIQSDDSEVKEKVKKLIDQIVAENQVLNVEIEQSMIGLTFGETGKAMKKKITEELGVWMGIDSTDSHVILRGTQEKIEDAAVVLRNFIAENYTSEFELQSDDESVLFHGGSESILSKIEKTHDVSANFRRSTQRVFVRGRKENVEAAIEELKRFMIGGDGFLVCKVKVPESSIGIVIGKGGSNIAKLEKDYEGVIVDLLRSSGKLSIRGPENSVKECRSNVITLLATTRITETIPINFSQHDILTKPDVMRRITDGLGVQVTLSDESVKIRGITTDVKDAKALMMEQITGKFETAIDLEPSQLTKVSKTVKDPSHFNRICEATKAHVLLDASTSSIVITGKRANVKKAKNQLYGLLDFIVPSEFAKVKVSKPLLKYVGDAASLAQISADTGASVSLDRELSCIQIRSTNPDEVNYALDRVKERIAECEKLNYVVRFESADSWLLPRIIGRGGATVQAIQNESGCSVDVYKEELTVAISGETEEAVATAKASLEKVIEQARKECIFIDIPESAMSAFIGKSGANIKLLAEQSNVDIERMRKEPSRMRIQGDEVCVQAAKAAVMKWLKNWESKNIGITITVDKTFIPAVLGRQGAVINAIQHETGCRIDIDRQAQTVTVRGGNENGREKAVENIEKIIQDEKDKENVKKLEREEVRQKHLAEQEAKKVEQTATPNEVIVESQPECNKLPDDDMKPIDRSNEFAAKPVGGFVENGDSKKPSTNGKRSKKKSKNTEKNVSEVEETRENPRGTVAAKNLFHMLVSEPQSDQNKKNSKQSNGTEEQSDTLSTVTANTDESPSDTTQQKPYYKSASGFTIRL